MALFCIAHLCGKFARRCPRTQTPTQNLKSGFSMLSSKENGSILISFERIFEALQSELFRLMFHKLSSKILKTPEFNLNMTQDGFQNDAHMLGLPHMYQYKLTSFGLSSSISLTFSSSFALLCSVVRYLFSIVAYNLQALRFFCNLVFQYVTSTRLYDFQF